MSSAELLVTTLPILKSSQTHLYAVIKTTGLNKYTNSEAYKIQNKTLEEKHLWQLSTTSHFPMHNDHNSITNPHAY